jgi:hypothetical protein
MDDETGSHSSPDPDALVGKPAVLSRFLACHIDVPVLLVKGLAFATVSFG